jgi:transcription elongation factor Elf1
MDFITCQICLKSPRKTRKAIDIDICLVSHFSCKRCGEGGVSPTVKAIKGFGELLRCGIRYRNDWIVVRLH